MIPSRIIGGGLAVAAIAALAAPAAAPAAKHRRAPAAKALYYVSVGDSYASGYQPAPNGGLGRNSTAGFAYQLPRFAARRGWKLRVVNFGCGGATTTSVLKDPGCAALALGPGAPHYASTQAAAAARFLKAHRGQVGLITVSIGGNDVTSCVREPNPVVCVANASGVIRRNVRTLATKLRAAAGRGVRIVGTTYPDVVLGAWLSGDAGRGLATLSVTAFRSVINPTLKEEYQDVGGSFADVTAATGAYGPLTQTTTLAPYGTIPVPVAKVCQLTWYCQLQDIHPKTPGYTLIARLVARTLPVRRG